MKAFTVRQAKTHLSRLLKALEEGGILRNPRGQARPLPQGEAPPGVRSGEAPRGGARPAGRRYLLDTHVLLWAPTEPKRLSPRVRVRLQDPDTPLLVSPASAGEMAPTHRLAKLSGAEAVLLEGHLPRLGAEELPLRLAHALLAGRLPGEHEAFPPFGGETLG